MLDPVSLQQKIAIRYRLAAFFISRISVLLGWFNFLIIIYTWNGQSQNGLLGNLRGQTT